MIRSDARKCYGKTPNGLGKVTVRIWRALIAALMIAVAPAVARAVVTELKIPLGAGGFGFLPLHMMQKYNLIEKYAEEAALKVTVTWSNIGGPSGINVSVVSE